MSRLARSLVHQVFEGLVQDRFHLSARTRDRVFAWKMVHNFAGFSTRDWNFKFVRGAQFLAGRFASFLVRNLRNKFVPKKTWIRDLILTGRRSWGHSGRFAPERTRLVA